MAEHPLQLRAMLSINGCCGCFKAASCMCAGAPACAYARLALALQSGENEDELMDRETQLQLIAMGIPSPVTKESAGKTVG